MAKAAAPCWKHIGGTQHRCGAQIQIMQVTFPNAVAVELHICPRCDRLSPNPNLL